MDAKVNHHERQAVDEQTDLDDGLTDRSCGVDDALADKYWVERIAGSAPAAGKSSGRYLHLAAGSPIDIQHRYPNRVLATYTYEEPKSPVHCTYNWLARIVGFIGMMFGKPMATPQASSSYKLSNVNTSFNKLLELDLDGRVTNGILAAVAALIQSRQSPGSLIGVERLCVDLGNNRITLLSREEVTITSQEKQNDMNVTDNENFNGYNHAKEKKEVTPEDTDEEYLMLLLAELEKLEELEEQRGEPVANRTVDQIWAEASVSLMGIRAEFASLTEQSSTPDLSKTTPAEQPIYIPTTEEADRVASILTTWEEAVYQLCRLFEQPDVRTSGDSEDLWSVVEEILDRYDIGWHSPATVQLVGPMLKDGYAKTLSVSRTRHILEGAKLAREQMAQAVMTAFREGDMATSSHLVTLMMRRCEDKVDRIVSALENSILAVEQRANAQPVERQAQPKPVAGKNLLPSDTISYQENAQTSRTRAREQETEDEGQDVYGDGPPLVSYAFPYQEVW